MAWRGKNGKRSFLSGLVREPDYVDCKPVERYRIQATGSVGRNDSPELPPRRIPWEIKIRTVSISEHSDDIQELKAK